MTEAVGFSHYTSSIETFYVDPEQREVSSESEKTTYVVRTVFDPMGEVVELYKEMSNEGLLKRDNVVIIQDKAVLRNSGEIQAKESVKVEGKEIFSLGSIEAKTVELVAEKVHLIGELAFIRADEILIRASEIVIDGARVEGGLKLESCDRLEVSNVSAEAVRAWEEAAPEGCAFVASTTPVVVEEQAEAEEVAQVEEQAETDEVLVVAQQEACEETSEVEEQVEAEEACPVQEEAESAESEETVAA